MFSARRWFPASGRCSAHICSFFSPAVETSCQLEHYLFSIIVSDWLPAWWTLRFKCQTLAVSPKCWTAFAHLCVCNMPGCAKFPVWGVSEAELSQPGTEGTAVCPEQIRKSIQRMKMHLWRGIWTVTVRSLPCGGKKIAWWGGSLNSVDT